MKKSFIVSIVLLIVVAGISIGLFVMTETNENPGSSSANETIEPPLGELSTASNGEQQTVLTVEEVMAAFAQAESEVGDEAVKSISDLTQEKYLDYLGEITDRAYAILSNCMEEGYSADALPFYMNTNVYDGASFIVSSENQEMTGDLLLWEFFHPSKDLDTGEINVYQFGKGSAVLLQEGTFTQLYPTERQQELLNSLPTEADLAKTQNATE